LGADDGFCSKAADRFCRSVQFCAWVTIVFARHPAYLAERAEGAARAGRAGITGRRLCHAVTVFCLAWALWRATLCQVMASLVLITRPLNADMIPPKDLIS
jgi:hypothetical protein